MRGRLVIGVIVAVALLGGPALGAPKASCQMLTDPAGDGSLHGSSPQGTPTYPASLDILSADIASDATTLTAVIRVAGLSSVDTGSPTGLGYDLLVSVHGQRFRFYAQRHTGSEDRFTMSVRLEHVGDENTGSATWGLIGHIDGIFDEDASEIRMHAPLSYFTPKVARGHRLSSLMLWSTMSTGFYPPSDTGVPGGSTGEGTDRAESAATYAAGSPSCVKVGY